MSKKSKQRKERSQLITAFGLLVVAAIAHYATSPKKKSKKKAKK